MRLWRVAAGSALSLAVTLALPSLAKAHDGCYPYGYGYDPSYYGPHDYGNNRSYYGYPGGVYPRYGYRYGHSYGYDPSYYGPHGYGYNRGYYGYPSGFYLRFGYGYPLYYHRPFFRPFFPAGRLHRAHHFRHDRPFRGFAVPRR